MHGSCIFRRHGNGRFTLECVISRRALAKPLPLWWLMGTSNHVIHSNNKNCPLCGETKFIWSELQSELYLLAKNCRDQRILGTHPSCSITVVTRPICANWLEILVPQLPGTVKVNPGRYRDCCTFTWFR
jgi:hypothetical protein